MIFLRKCSFIVDSQLRNALLCQHHAQIGANQLECITVASDDQRIQSSSGCLRRERADDIISFVACALNERYAKRCGKIVEQWYLPQKLSRSLVTRALIVGIKFRAECLFPFVKSDD